VGLLVIHDHLWERKFGDEGGGKWGANQTATKSAVSIRAQMAGKWGNGEVGERGRDRRRIFRTWCSEP